MSNDCVSKIEFVAHSEATRNAVLSIIHGVDKYNHGVSLDEFIKSNTETANDVTMCWYTEGWGPTVEAYEEIALIDGVTYFEALFWEHGMCFISVANKQGVFDQPITGRASYETPLGKAVVAAFGIDVDEWCCDEDEEE